MQINSKQNNVLLLKWTNCLSFGALFKSRLRHGCSNISFDSQNVALSHSFTKICLSFEHLNVEAITPFRSLEDEYGTISGLYSFVRTSVETASHRYLSSNDLHGMIPLKFKPSKVDFLLDTRLG